MRYTRLLIGTLVTVGLLAGLVVSPAYADPPFAPPGLARAIAVQEYHTNSLMAKSGVVGTAVGLVDGGPVVKIFTESAEVSGLPKTLDGIPVVVQVTGKLFALPKPDKPGKPPKENGEEVDPTARFERPVPIGVSTGNEGECSAGTIGARVKVGTNVYALSNNHVYALKNQAPNLSNVLQPGRFDSNCAIDPIDFIGQLFDYEPIVFLTSASNEIDASVALSSEADLGNATPSDGYGLPKSAIVSAAVGQAVQKYGRTTQLTKGTVTGINATVFVGYSSGTARFVDQIIVQSNKPFLKSGDSGSLLVTDPDRNPVGLLFAGNRSGKLAVANRIDLVLERFGVDIDGN